MSQLLLVKLDKNNNIIQYPYTIEKLKKDNPSISFSKDINAEVLFNLNVAIVEPTPLPVADVVNENISQMRPVFVDNKWKQCWVVMERTEEQKQNVLKLISNNYSNAINNYLHSGAKKHNYFGIISACSYAVSTDPVFSNEGRKFVEWRDRVWNHFFTIMDNIKNGQRPLPSVKEVIESLPKLEL